MNRILHQINGKEKGPLLIIIGSIHGNEHAGIIAMNKFFKKLEDELDQNPGFYMSGRIVGLVGNLNATRQKLRFIDEDLNRMFIPERILNLKKSDPQNTEESELKELIQVIENEINQAENQMVGILDLHTTTAEGGIFLIPAENESSIEIAKQLNAPLIHGFLNELNGTLLHYFNGNAYQHVKLHTLCFESGQHDDPNSSELACSMIIQFFSALGGFLQEDIEDKHKLLLEDNSITLPKEAKLVYRHSIQSDDKFLMRQDKVYKNFDPIQKDEYLADDIHGKIFAPCQGFILMPLYQKKGNDGFFIIQLKK
jgi:succinylglutamate desuccinylase